MVLLLGHRRALGSCRSEIDIRFRLHYHIAPLIPCLHDLSRTAPACSSPSVGEALCDMLCFLYLPLSSLPMSDLSLAFISRRGGDRITTTATMETLPFILLISLIYKCTACRPASCCYCSCRLLRGARYIILFPPCPRPHVSTSQCHSR